MRTLLLALLLISTPAAATDPLIGTWYGPRGTLTIEQGKLRHTAVSYPHATWRTDGKTLSFTWNPGMLAIALGQVTCTYSLSATVLKLNHPCNDLDGTYYRR